VAAPLAPIAPRVEARRKGGSPGGSAARLRWATSHGFVARAESATANGLDLRADRPSVAAFGSDPDSYGMLALASSDDPADTPGDQPARARCAAMRAAAACHDFAAPDDLTHAAAWLQERTADGV
jgi:hypothetical protein